MPAQLLPAAVAVTVVLVLLMRPIQWRSTRVLVFAGVLLHELSHWLVALVLGCRPTAPSVRAKKQTDGSWKLGSVDFEARRGRTAWVGFAPTLLCLPALQLLSIEGNLFTVFVSSMVAGYLLWASLPSPQDVAVSLSDPLGLLMVAGAASLAWLALT